MYITKQQANTSIKVPLDFDGGDYYLNVVSAYSDQFRQARDDVRGVSLYGDVKLTSVQIKERLLASIITGWKLPKEIKAGACNFDNALKLLQNYPELCDDLDDVISRKANFIEKK
jgi:hypothetical protein